MGKFDNYLKRSELKDLCDATGADFSGHWMYMKEDKNGKVIRTISGMSHDVVESPDRCFPAVGIGDLWNMLPDMIECAKSSASFNKRESLRSKETVVYNLQINMVTYEVYYKDTSDKLVRPAGLPVVLINRNRDKERMVVNFAELVKWCVAQGVQLKNTKNKNAHSVVSKYVMR